MKKSGSPYTLAIDIGGTGLKASVLDARGRMVAKPVRVDTPYPCTPKAMVDALVRMVKPLPRFDRISIGFPGVVRNDRIITAAHYGIEKWRNFQLAKTLTKRLGKPARIVNDADMQGLAVMKGKGLEIVITLGTGVGTAIFQDGELMIKVELSTHPYGGSDTYNTFIGHKTFLRIGKKAWNKRVRKAIDQIYHLFFYDKIYVGGGNARHITFRPDKNMKIISNDAGILGGIALWRLKKS